MKKIKYIFAAVAAIGIIFAAAVGASDFETWYVGARSGLNCRKAPTTDAEVLTVYENGTELQIIGVDNSGEWWETWDGVTQGWCHSDYLRSTKDEAEQTVQTGGMRYIGDFKCTTYTPDPAENGGSNYTACGDLLTDVVGYAIAVDPNVIPYGTRVYIKDIGYRVARDCGGAIKGNRIDVLAWSNTMSELGGYSTHEVYVCE